jgi:Fe-S-cluster containining protein
VGHAPLNELARRLPVLNPPTPDAVFSFAMHAFGQSWASGRSGVTAAAVGEEVGLWFDEVTSRISPSPSLYACRDGCSFCCHLKVIASPPEVIAMIEWIRKHLPEEELSALRTRVTETDQRTHGLTATERAELRLPCPMLRDNRCVGYEARPAACRSANSFDAGACEAAFQSNAEVEVPHDEATRVYADALRGAAASTAARAGCDPRMLELVAALRIGLEESTTSDAWTHGKRVFENAVDREFAANLERRQAPR